MFDLFHVVSVGVDSMGRRSASIETTNPGFHDSGLTLRQLTASINVFRFSFCCCFCCCCCCYCCFLVWGVVFHTAHEMSCLAASVQTTKQSAKTYPELEGYSFYIEFLKKKRKQ